eukprot:7277484-Pyramimonas_sp.AAC.2
MAGWEEGGGEAADLDKCGVLQAVLVALLQKGVGLQGEGAAAFVDGRCDRTLGVVHLGHDEDVSHGDRVAVEEATGPTLGQDGLNLAEAMGEPVVAPRAPSLEAHAELVLQEADGAVVSKGSNLGGAQTA